MSIKYISMKSGPSRLFYYTPPSDIESINKAGLEMLSLSDNKTKQDLTFFTVKLYLEEANIICPEVSVS